MGYFLTTALAVLDRQDEFDLIHSHLEWMSLLLAAGSQIPLAATFHGRLDLPYSRELLALADVRPPRGHQHLPGVALIPTSIGRSSTTA